MTVPVWLFGIVAEAIPLVREFIGAVRTSDEERAIEAAKSAVAKQIQRKAEIEAFKATQRELRRKK